MKIAIDISAVIYKTGVSQSVAKSVESLLFLDKENEYILFGGSLRRMGELNAFTKSLKGNFRKKLYPFPPSLLDFVWNRFPFPKVETLTGKIDIFHSSDWVEPPARAFKVTTIHDLAPFKYPKLHHPKIVATHKRKIRRTMKNVDRVIVPSKKTAEDLQEMGMEKERIRIIPWAPVYKKAAKEAVTAVKRKYKINGDFLLAVGANPRKNTKRIVEAFDLVKAGKDLTLIIAGSQNMEIEERRGVRLTGTISNEEMGALYTGAKALLYPSIYEGFGLPILDAFNCETPVVTSNVSSMPEVAGGAALLVDPQSTKSIVRGIEEALANEKTYIKKGKARAKEFSWEKVAKDILEVYQEAKS